jgi:hypothetical protein
VDSSARSAPFLRGVVAAWVGLVAEQAQYLAMWALGSTGQSLRVAGEPVRELGGGPRVLVCS